jgi:hypothetical protein
MELSTRNMAFDQSIKWSIGFLASLKQVLKSQLARDDCYFILQAVDKGRDLNALPLLISRPIKIKSRNATRATI